MADALKRSSFQNCDGKDQNPSRDCDPNYFENRSIECVDDLYEIRDPFGIFHWIRRRTMIEVRPIQQKQSRMSWVSLRVGIALISKLLCTAAIALWTRVFH
jgi:hypothetical protein